MKCANCGKENLSISERCVECRTELPEEIAVLVLEKEELSKGEQEAIGFGVSALICGVVALIFVPPLFGILGVVFGFKTTKRNIVIGLGLIFFCVICMIIGFVNGFNAFLNAYYKALYHQH